METTDLIPRPEIRATLIDALRPASVLLYGPRRVGKSTLLDQLSADPPEGLTMLRIDLEGHLQRPVEQLAEQLHQALVTADPIHPNELLGRRHGRLMPALLAMLGWLRYGAP